MLSDKLIENFGLKNNELPTIEHAMNALFGDLQNYQMKKIPQVKEVDLEGSLEKKLKCFRSGLDQRKEVVCLDQFEDLFDKIPDRKSELNSIETF